jgi:hypothetical protein
MKSLGCGRLSCSPLASVHKLYQLCLIASLFMAAVEARQIPSHQIDGRVLQSTEGLRTYTGGLEASDCTVNADHCWDVCRVQPTTTSVCPQPSCIAVCPTSLGQLLVSLGRWWLVLEPAAGTDGGQGWIQLSFPRNISTSDLVAGKCSSSRTSQGVSSVMPVGFIGNPWIQMPGLHASLTVLSYVAATCTMAVVMGC